MSKDIKVPVHSIEAEHSILWSALIDKDTVPIMISKLEEDYFYNDNNKIIFKSIKSLSIRWLKIDLITVMEDLKWQEVIIKLNNWKEIVDKYKKSNVLEEIWWMTFLCELTEIVPTTSNILEYINIVREKYLLRKFMYLSWNIDRWINNNLWLKEIQDLIDNELRVITWLWQTSTTKHISEVIDDKYHRIINNINNQESKSNYIKTWIKTLDDKIIWLWNWELIVVAWVTSMWKTFTSMNLVNKPLIEWKKVYVFSTETSKESIQDIFVSLRHWNKYTYKSLKEIDKKVLEIGNKITFMKWQLWKPLTIIEDKIKLLNLKIKEWEKRIADWIDNDDKNIILIKYLIKIEENKITELYKTILDSNWNNLNDILKEYNKEKHITENLIMEITESINELYEDKLLINDSMWLTVDDIKNMVLAESMKDKVDIIVIDQLSKLSWPWKWDTERYGILTNRLISLAKELDIPIILNVQLKINEIWKSVDKTPVLDNIKSTSAIADDASKVLLINRPLYWDLKDKVVWEHTDLTLHMNIAKNRWWQTCTIVLWCDIAYQRLRDPTESELRLSNNIFT